MAVVVMFHVLGPLHVETAGGTIKLRPGMPQRVLAVLLLQARFPVTVSELIDALWPDDPPANAVKVVQTYVHRLRRDLGSDHRIRSSSDGYLIDVRKSDVDSEVFVAEIVQARRARDAGEIDQAICLLDQALHRWRGRPYGGLGVGPLFASEIARLGQWHASAVMDRAELHLLAGSPEQAIPVLSGLMAERPHQDRAATQLMLALVRSGRRVDALDVYHQHRRGLVEELGLEPSAELKRLHVDILRDQIASTVSETPVTRRANRTLPRQLPPGVFGFTGRQEQLRRLDQLTAGATLQTPNTVVISAVAGAAGIGKTSLAIHWAHQAVHHFPDGQLYVDLRGYDPTGRPTHPASAIRGFLDALGVDLDQVPQGMDAQAALFRSRVTGRQILLVLDNARDAQQVRPLLPGEPGCKVLITSRHQLLGLCASHGATAICLDHLSEAEATQLLAFRLGAKRIEAEPAAVSDIIRYCAGLPLALTITAARAAIRPADPLADIAKELLDAPRVLDSFHTTDIGTDLRAVFSWSQRWLTPAANALFGLLGLHPGPEISLPAAASLADLPISDAAPLLTELTEAHLISEPSPGRYTLHDLLHAYAGEEVRRSEPASRISAAKRRLIDHYLQYADAADQLINVDRRRASPPTVQSGIRPLFESEASAIEWLNAERACLLATLGVAASECDTSTWRLAMAMAHYLYRHGYWSEHLATSTAVFAAAQRSGDTAGQILVLINIGRAYVQMCQHDLAEAHLRTAIDLSASSRDTLGHAESLHVLSWVLDLQGKRHQAIAHAEQALALFRSADDPGGQARALNTLGWFHIRLGDHRQALDLCSAALRIHQELDHREGQAATWHSLGQAHHQLGDQQQALACYNNALRLYRDLRTPYFEGSTLAGIGDAYRAMDAGEAALGSWKNALTILDEIEHPEAEMVRAKVASATVRRNAAGGPTTLAG